MGLLSWLIFGALVGWLASHIMETRRKGLLRYMVLGLLGSFVGGFIASLFGFGSVASFDIESFAFALLGAILLIAIFRKL